MINQNELAKKVASLEHGKDQVNIGQIKEIIARTLDLLSSAKYSEVLALLEKR